MADSKSFVALNIGSQRVSMAVFSATPEGGLLLKGYESSNLLADPAADASRLVQVRVAVNELTEKLGVKKRPVRYAISGQSVFTRFVKLPPLTEEKVDQIVEFEAQQNVPFPINEVIWDYQLVGSAKSSDVEVVLVAIKSDSLNEINEAVAASTLRTEIVDVAPMALYNAFRYNYSDIAEPSLLVDIGSRTTNLIYIEGNRAFTRSIPVGGSTITGAISKEFAISFNEAEQRKIANGFVALGGAYADHEDPEIAAMSKVIRNTLTRLHAEVVRTNNFYRTQQGGSLPALVFLCGASATMPYIRDFFMEKLGLQVEFFNPLRNVLVAGDADAGKLSHEAHMLGELTGLGLRGLSSCPMELDLVPGTVQKARDLAERKPSFVMAGCSVVALLAAAGYFFDRGSLLAEEKKNDIAGRTSVLRAFDKEIQKWTDVQKAVDVKTKPFTSAVIERIFWVTLLGDINSNLNSDLVWLTTLEPYSNGEPVTSSFFGVAAPKPSKKKKGDDAKANPNKDMIDAIHVTGLYRENSSGQTVVVDFVNRIKAASSIFALEEVDTNDILKVDAGVPGERWAWTFDLTLPLKKEYYIPFKK